MSLKELTEWRFFLKASVSAQVACISLMLATYLWTKFQMDSVQLSAFSPPKIFTSIPTIFMIIFPVLCSPPGIIKTTTRLKNDIWDPRIRERWLSQHPPLLCEGRDGYYAIWSMTTRTQSLALPDIACSPSGPPDIHSHLHSCTSPTTPTPTPFGRKYPHSWIGFIECFYFCLIKLWLS